MENGVAEELARAVNDEIAQPVLQEARRLLVFARILSIAVRVFQFGIVSFILTLQRSCSLNHILLTGCTNYKTRLASSVSNSPFVTFYSGASNWLMSGSHLTTESLCDWLIRDAF